MKTVVQLCASLLLVVSTSGCCLWQTCDPCGGPYGGYSRPCFLQRVRDFLHCRHHSCGYGCGMSCGNGCANGGMMYGDMGGQPLMMQGGVIQGSSIQGGMDGSGCGCGAGGASMDGGLMPMPNMPSVPSMPTYSVPTNASPTMQTPPPAPMPELSRTQTRVNPQMQQRLAAPSQGPVQVSVEEFNSLPGTPVMQPAAQWVPASK